MSKQVNHVNNNIEPKIYMELLFLMESIAKYNSFVNPFSTCKPDIVYCRPYLHTLQCKGWLKRSNNSNNILAILHENKLSS